MCPSPLRMAWALHCMASRQRASSDAVVLMPAGRSRPAALSSREGGRQSSFIWTCYRMECAIQ